MVKSNVLEEFHREVKRVAKDTKKVLVDNLDGLHVKGLIDAGEFEQAASFISKLAEDGPQYGNEDIADAMLAGARQLKWLGANADYTQRLTVLSSRWDVVREAMNIMPSLTWPETKKPKAKKK